MTPEIVVGIDDSAGARDALAFATRIATCAGATLRLATAYNYSNAPSRARNETFRRYLEQDALELLRSTAESVDGVSGTDASTLCSSRRTTGINPSTLVVARITRS